MYHWQNKLSACFCHWWSQTVILSVWQHCGKNPYRYRPFFKDHFYITLLSLQIPLNKNNNLTLQIFIKRTSFKLDTNKIKLTKWIFVNLSTAPTITITGLVEINPNFTSLEEKRTSLHIALLKADSFTALHLHQHAWFLMTDFFLWL